MQNCYPCLCAVPWCWRHARKKKSASEERHNRLTTLSRLLDGNTYERQRTVQWSLSIACTSQDGHMQCSLDLAQSHADPAKDGESPWPPRMHVLTHFEAHSWTDLPFISSPKCSGILAAPHIKRHLEGFVHSANCIVCCPTCLTACFVPCTS